jgi:hypothetical protein
MIRLRCGASSDSSSTSPNERVPVAGACTCIAPSAGGFWNTGSCYSRMFVPFVAENAVFVFTDPKKFPARRKRTAKRDSLKPTKRPLPDTAIRNPLALPTTDASPTPSVLCPTHKSVCIMARRGFRLQRFAATIVWPGQRAARLFALPMALPAGTGSYIFLRLLLAGFSDTWSDRSSWNSSRAELSR